MDPGARTARSLLLISLALLIAAPALAQPAGTMTWGVHVTLATRWLDTSDTESEITPFMILYALHDALVKPMPGNLYTPCLAESWTMSRDGRVWEFVLRKGVKFHNGDPVTAEDVKFSFERYKGGAATLFRERVREVQVVDPGRVRFVLKEPWPDFMTFYGTSASGAAYVVPKKYVEKVGEDGFRKAPIGAGPYRFVSFQPGVELVLEAFEGYWRKTPNVKRLVIRSIPDEATRAAALKRGDVDVVYYINGPIAEDVRRTPGLTLAATRTNGVLWIEFPEQWDPKSPWHDPRVRLATKFALDYNTINKALTLGYSHITGSIIPENFEFYEKLAPPVYDPNKAKQLLAEAGHAGGFDAGFYTCDVAYANLGEAAINYLGEVGIRAKLRPLERAAFFKGYADKKYKNIIQGSSGAFGNAATRLEEFVIKGGNYAYGSYPEIDELFPLQAVELDYSKRAAILAKMQRLLDERSMYVSIWQLAFISGVGPRVAESGFGLIKGYVYTAPYEEITLKSA
jgi:peptide/nickel transport system substrate-binding protein